MQPEKLFRKVQKDIADPYRSLEIEPIKEDNLRKSLVKIGEI